MSSLKTVHCLTEQVHSISQRCHSCKCTFILRVLKRKKRTFQIVKHCPACYTNFFLMISYLEWMSGEGNQRKAREEGKKGKVKKNKKENGNKVLQIRREGGVKGKLGE